MKSLVLIALFFAYTFAAPVCTTVTGQQGYFITINGKTYPCATTTRYWDGFKGACGCGAGENNGFAYPFQYQVITAAASNSVFGTGEWCGESCGKCYAITPTGGFVDGQGTAPPNLQTQVMMVTNLCPRQYNVQWCTSPNQYGYMAHFDLNDYNMNGLIASLGWNNIEVYYYPIPCPARQANDWTTCQCATDI